MIADIMQILKDMSLEIRNLNGRLEDLCDIQSSRAKTPYHCPICNGSTVDEEGVKCIPCDGNGIIWM